VGGCGDPTSSLAPVSGVVYFRGSPLNGGSIVFTPDPERGGRGPLAFARIEADGRFVLHTGSKPGAVPGWHRITIKAFPPAESGAAPAAALPAKYSDPDQSGESREVKAEVANRLDFHLD
jgi:hypothetical protein